MSPAHVSTGLTLSNRASVAQEVPLLRARPPCVPANLFSRTATLAGYAAAENPTRPRMPAPPDATRQWVGVTRCSFAVPPWKQSAMLVNCAAYKAGRRVAEPSVSQELPLG